MSPYVPSCRYLWTLCLIAPPYVPPYVPLCPLLQIFMAPMSRCTTLCPPMSPPADIYGPLCLIAPLYVPLCPLLQISMAPYVSLHCHLSPLCPRLCPLLCPPYVPSCRYLLPTMSRHTTLCPILH